MLAGEAGPGGGSASMTFTPTYLVGSIALALILFDGGFCARALPPSAAWFAPSLVLATFGVLLTAALTAPAAKYLLGLDWIEALLVGAVVASTDAAAVVLPGPCRRGYACARRVGATLEV